MMQAQDSEIVSRAFVKAENDLQLRHSRVGACLALIMVPSGSSLDVVVYPEFFWPLLWSRVVCELCLLPILPALCTAFGKRHIQFFSAVLVLAPMLMIAWMIYITQGSTSPYYAGLMFMIMVTCLMLPYSLLQATSYCVTVLSCYLAACLLHAEGPLDPRQLFNNLFFLALTSVVGVATCHLFRLRRFEDVRLRQELDARNQELNQLDQLRSRFFANVSHELRTPLTLIISPLDSLLSRHAALSPAVVESLETMRQNSLRLLRLINDLLEVVRLEEGRLTLQCKPLALDDFVAGLVESVRGLAKNKGLSLSVETPPEPLVVQADHDRLEKVFLNLLSNAVKFTPEGGAVRVRCWREDSPADGSLAKVAVTDTGEGISSEDLPFIFDRFQQAGRGASRQKQGLGLGLALAKELVVEHGGELTATSRPDHGSTFTVCLPASTGSVEEDETPRHEDQEQSGALVEMFRAAARSELGVEASQAEDLAEAGDGDSTVLVIDDERDMRRFLVSVLSEQYRVVQAADGTAGLELARREAPQLVVVDLMLPGINGLEVCRALRAGEGTSNIKLLMLTARIDEESKIEALESGVDDFLTKPFSSVELKTRIRNLLAAACLEEDLRHRNRELSETIARLRSTEAQLVQSEKMNALGSLAGGLLHEINNPLNHTMMALEVARMSADPDDADLRETLDDIDIGMKRIGEIVSDLRAFAYPEQMDVQAPFNIRDALDTSLRFTAGEMHNVEIDSGGLNGHLVLGSRTHVTQVLVNMLVNASHALKPVGGRRSPKVRVWTSHSRGRLYIHVWDNGVGIDPDHAGRIFDPFFTTREIGEGTGLGLSICHTIVRNHGGRIHVRSEPGNWTEFTFDLPLWGEDERG